MTHKVSFNVRLENDPTKTGEIMTLNQMVNKFKGSGTYLEMLFSADLLDWFEGQVRNDFAPDVMDHMVAATVDANEAKDMLKTSHEASSIWEKDCKYSRERMVELDGLHLGEMKVLEQRLRDANEKATQYFNELRKVEAQVDHLDEANVRLKARLYDREENKIEGIEDRLDTLENPPDTSGY